MAPCAAHAATQAAAVWVSHLLNLPILSRVRFVVTHSTQRNVSCPAQGAGASALGRQPPAQQAAGQHQQGRRLVPARQAHGPHGLCVPCTSSSASSSSRDRCPCGGYGGPVTQLAGRAAAACAGACTARRPVFAAGGPVCSVQDPAGAVARRGGAGCVFSGQLLHEQRKCWSWGCKAVELVWPACCKQQGLLVVHVNHGGR
jgi:hypothetical protein